MLVGGSRRFALPVDVLTNDSPSFFTTLGLVRDPVDLA
jgi:hypothetical protein